MPPEEFSHPYLSQAHAIARLLLYVNAFSSADESSGSSAHNNAQIHKVGPAYKEFMSVPTGLLATLNLLPSPS